MVGEITPRRSKDAVEEDIKRFKEWLEKQPHLPHDVELELLSVFVQGTKSLEIAKKKFDNYFSNRNRAIKLYDLENRDASSERYKQLSQAVNQFFLPTKTTDGCRVLLINLGEQFDLFEHLHEATRLLMNMELAMKKWPDAEAYYLIIDVKGAPPSSAAKISPAILASSIGCYQDGYPIVLRGGFIINAPPFVEFIVNNLVKPIMKSKLFDRIKVTAEGFSTVKDIIAEEALPCDLGGKEKSASELNEYWLELLEKNKEWFAATSQASDENKRPHDGTDTYGVEGTFRKLAVD